VAVASVVSAFSAALLALAGAVPGAAKPSPSAAQVSPPLISPRVGAGSDPAVAAYYEARRIKGIWLVDPTTIAAAKSLVPVLRRSQIDGFAKGPALAAVLEQGLARADTLAPAERLETDRLISTIWVQYVQALRAPVQEMIYGDPRLVPQVPTPSRILADAFKAASLLNHVQDVARVNPVYADLRAAAWAQMNLGGGVALDPRTLANLRRARILPTTGRYIIVDAATAQLWMYQDGRVEDSMKVVVGKRSSPTPMLAGTIHYVTFNPYWNIPPDVAATAVAPIVLKRGTKYLKLAQYEVASDFTDQATVVPPDEIDWQAVAAGTSKIRVRQLPGPRNMMGAIKFGFANDQGIYLHDTPEKQLFAKPRRTYSLGCVRVEHADRLARWLLKRDAVAPSADPEQHVRLAEGVPIFITYLTAQAQDGQLTFAEDIYGHDPKPLSEFVAGADSHAAPPAPATDIADRNETR
jgi:lipoprotein-anchoring transpeptidase ErfK/SrfK